MGLLPFGRRVAHGFLSNRNFRDVARFGRTCERSVGGRAQLRTLSARGAVLLKAASVGRAL